MARSSQLIVLLLGTFVLISLTLEAQGKPSVSMNRRKRQTVAYYDSPIENEEENFDSESDTNYDRNARRSDTQTFPSTQQVVPWVKRQWGSAKHYFKKHYDNIG
ncbi:unnamed protein product [Orchesella dallaii]|uniref:Uncharacterized protein n=1 Tax=Orchesella dallaii TaxID=48710 RepID=A0ABP1QGU5_9HEXA